VVGLSNEGDCTAINAKQQLGCPKSNVLSYWVLSLLFRTTF